jgi:hypothetical protein
MISMRAAGHNQQFRLVVAHRILANYQNIVKNDEDGTKLMYRSKEERRDQKIAEGVTDKGTWFRKGGYTATYTVPASKDSGLTQRTRQPLDSTSGPDHTKVKVLERPGVSILSGLVKSNPFPRQTCGRISCPLKWMEKGCQEKCFMENITYQAHCTRCRQEQVDRGVEAKEVRDQVYDGESSRTLHTRAGQHFGDYAREASKHHNQPHNAHLPGQVEEEEGSSFMWDHAVNAHQGQVSLNITDDFQFRVTGQFRDPLTRELTESTRIIFARKNKDLNDTGQGRVYQIGGVLNRKDEHFAPRVRFCQ